MAREKGSQFSWFSSSSGGRFEKLQRLLDLCNHLWCGRGAARLLRVSCASPAHSSQHPHHHAHIAPQALPTASIAMKLLVVALAFASREAAAFMRVKALRKSGPQGVMPAQPRPAHAPTPALERGLSIRRVAVRSGKKTSILHPETRSCVCVPLDRGWLIGESSRARLRS